MPTDRFLIAAVTDRLIYGSETIFDPADARILLDALPRRKVPRWEFGMYGKVPGGSTEGYAAGVGSTTIDDDKERSFAFSTRKDAWIRAGQWKLGWSKRRGMQTIEIEQVMSDMTEEGRSAKIHYTNYGTPTGMDILASKSFALLTIEVVVQIWRPWKVPVSV